MHPSSYKTAIIPKYTPRKQLTWAQCHDYLKSPVLIFIQLNNLDTPTRMAVKSKLRSLGLHLKSPKAHIMRKVVRQSPFSNLEGSIIGPTSLLLSMKDPSELREGIQYISSQNRALIVGGKIDTHTFSVDGIKTAILDTPSLTNLRATLIHVLLNPSISLKNSLNSSPTALAALLERRQQHALD